MAIKPVSDWASSYEDLFFKDMSKEKSATVWGDWVHQNTQGLAGAPPWTKTSVTLSRPAFPPVTLPPNPKPDTFCNLLAAAWFAYISSAIWTPPPPIPPFSVIALVAPSMTGIGTAKETLLATLISIFSAPASASSGFMKNQAMQIATAFYTATISSGIMISGTSTPPPAPLVLPLLPVV